MEFRILGPLEAREGGLSLPLGGPKQRALLAVLLLHADEVVGSDRITDELWGERPPESAPKLVQGYVSGLRKTLGNVVVTQSPGYVIRLSDGELDLRVFERLVREAGDAPPERAGALLREALGLWRGPALAGLPLDGVARQEIDRINELRVAAQVERIEVDLSLGRHGAVAGELETLIAEHPYRERLRGQLMLALYRSGRQAEALEAYRQTRAVLSEELGIEPSRELQELERRILAHDPTLVLEPFPKPPLPERVVEPAVPAAEPAPVPERPKYARKTVSVVFCDLSDSATLAERLDPEVLHQVMSRYYETAAAVLGRHGGTLEKFIGDAVVAVYGVPRVREDDALRAVRSALELRGAVHALNDELEEELGVALHVHIGVNTGEVFLAPGPVGGPLVTGDAVSVAARLQQVADTDEIFVGASTYELVAHVITAEAVEPLRLRGRTGTVEAWRLLGIADDPGSSMRPPRAAFVGRGRELEQVRQAFEDAIVERECRRCTVVGPAGIGKSRLAREFIDSLGTDATALVGRCPHYGEGITYWPLRDMLRQVHGDPRAWIAGLIEDDEQAALIAERVLGAAGMTERASSKDETFWAVRKLFEALARRRPLVVVVDDVHWAEPTLLELLEHLLAFSGDATILLLCLARSDFLEEHPAWAAPRPSASIVPLAPFDEEESTTLLGLLPGGGDLSGTSLERVVEGAEGNPLYLEQLLALQAEAGDSDVSLAVPPGIQALLAARIDRLDPEERVVLEWGAVEGRIFHYAALAELLPAPTLERLDAHLLTLVRKELIHPSRAELAGEEAFRFRHILIRDAAYAALPKQTRADLHERFAGWLARAASERGTEFEEIVGYHLEQAFRCRRELRTLVSSDPHAHSLAVRAAEQLESPGRRALARGDLPAAVGLLERAVGLLAVDDAGRAALLPELGAALIEAGQLEDARRVLAEATQLAVAVHDERAEAHALVQQQFLQLVRVADGGTEEAARAVESVVPVFERYGDHHGLCRARRLEAWLHWNAARAAAAAEAWEQAAAHARRAGDEDERSEILNWIASAMFFGPTPVSEGIRRCEEIRVEVTGNLASEAWTLRSLAGLHAMDGRIELARELLADSKAIFEELGQTLNSSVSHLDGIVEMLADDPAAAERGLLEGYRALEGMGDKAFLSTTAAFLAHAVYAQGRDEEASRYTQISEELADSEDLITQIMWRSARAGLLARQGRIEEAEALAREAVTTGEATDFVTTHADALIDLAEILQQAGRLEEARSAAAEGLALYEQKENSVAARSTRARLAVLFQV